MTDQEYLTMQNSLTLMAQSIMLYFPHTGEINDFLERINHAEAMGPILDPTIFMKAQDKLRLIKTIAAATLRYRKELDGVREEIRRFADE